MIGRDSKISATALLLFIARSLLFLEVTGKYAGLLFEDWYFVSTLKPPHILAFRLSNQSRNIFVDGTQLGNLHT